MRFRIIKKHYYAENTNAYLAQYEFIQNNGSRFWKPVEHEILSCRITSSSWSSIEFETSEDARKAISDYKKSQLPINEQVS
jgi:hypothetical protein